jgi:hypothetical protein
MMAQAQDVISSYVGKISGSFGSLTQYNSGNCASGTTCNTATNVTLPAGGEACVVSASYANNQPIISSVTGQTGYRLNNWTNSTSSGGFDQFYIPSTSSTSGSPLTVNFSATNGGGVFTVLCRPYTGGTPTLDAINGLSSTVGTTSLTQVPLTISGKNAFAVAIMPEGCNTSSFISSPWTDGVYLENTLTGHAQCSADQANVASVTTPTWSGGTPFSFDMFGAAGVALSFSPTTSVQWGLMDSNAGTSGVKPTATTLANSAFGAPSAGNPSGSPNLSWNFVVNDASNVATYLGSTGDACTNAHHGLLNAAPRFIFQGGVTYPNASTLGIKFASGATSNIVWNLPGGGGTTPNLTNSTFTESVDMCTTLAVTDNYSAEHLFMSDMSTISANIDIVANGSSMYFTCAIGAGGACLTGLNSGVAATVPYTSGTWVKLDIQMNGGLGSQSPTSPSSLSIGSNTITVPGGCPYNTNAPWYIAGTGTAEFAKPASPCSGGVVTLTVVGTHSSGYTMIPADVMTILNDSGVVQGTFYQSAASDYAEYGRIGPAGTALPTGRAMYFDKWVVCYDMLNGAVCPATLVP